jgi:hypothetical protein
MWSRGSTRECAIEEPRPRCKTSLADFFQAPEETRLCGGCVMRSVVEKS